jgi:signal recognition particle subunit SRP72
MPTKQGSAAKRTPFTPKPARPITGRIYHLHRSLVDQINGGYLTNGIKTCHKILSLLSGEDVPEELKIELDGESITASKQEIKSNALQTLLFLLLQTDQYNLALETIESASHSDKLEFEKAYCLYRLHEEERARELVEKLRLTEGGSVGLEQESARRLAHLEAQVVSLNEAQCCRKLTCILGLPELSCGKLHKGPGNL